MGSLSKNTRLCRLKSHRLSHRAGGLIAVLLAVFCPAVSFAADYIDGRIKLTLNESTGRFTLYYLTDEVLNRFEPLFSEQDNRTSSLAVMINEHIYKLGESPFFSIHVGGVGTNPALFFESPWMIVTEEFTFISVNGQSETSGVRLTIRLENKGNTAIDAGARLLIDTKLGENATANANHFITNERSIHAETLLDKKSPDKWWFSRNVSYGLMGSVSTAYSTTADNVHFANWKLLNDAMWELPANRRNFNNPPYSINDSAVSYVFNPQNLPAGEMIEYSILLAAADETGFAQVTFKQDRMPRLSDSPGTAPLRAGDLRRSPEDETMRNDLAILSDLLTRLEEYREGRYMMSKEELANIELIINRIKDRYNIR
jgi:hypothetical protein